MAYARPVVYQDDETRRLQEFLDAFLVDGEVRTALDAGCGYVLPIDFPRTVRLVGLDVSLEALRKNENIDEGIVGDLETYSLPRDAYDAVLCWTVLEHVRRPAQAVVNMARSLRPGGLLIVRVPLRWSLKGVLTRITPHRFHVWTYRHIFRVADAGMPGCGPYRTYLRRDIAPGRLVQLARAEDLERIYATTYRPTLGFPRILQAVWESVGTLGRLATLGSWDPEASEHIAVFQKRAVS